MALTSKVGVPVQSLEKPYVLDGKYRTKLLKIRQCRRLSWGQLSCALLFLKNGNDGGGGGDNDDGDHGLYHRLL